MNGRTIPPVGFESSFFDDKVQAVLEERFGSELGFPIHAFNACAELSGATSTDWKHGSDFLRVYCEGYREDKEWIARLLVEVSRHVNLPREQWTQTRWITEYWGSHSGTLQPAPLKEYCAPALFKEDDFPAPHDKAFPDKWEDVRWMLAEEKWPGCLATADVIRVKAGDARKHRETILKRWEAHIQASCCRPPE